MRYYKTFNNALKNAKEQEAVVKFIGFDDNMDKEYRVMSWEMFTDNYKDNSLWKLITIKFE